MIEKMLQKDPTERYQTAYGLLQDLRRCKALALSGKLDESFPLGQDDKVRRRRKRRMDKTDRLTLMR